MRNHRGNRGSGPLLKSHKNIGFLSNTGPDHEKITKLPSQHSMLGHHRHASETPFKWRFAGGPMMVRSQWYLDPPSAHQLRTKPKKNVNWTGPPLTKLSGSAHDLQTHVIIAACEALVLFSHAFSVRVILFGTRRVKRYRLHTWNVLNVYSRIC